MELLEHQLHYVENDTLPTLRGTLTEDDGVTAINITGWDIKIHIKYDTPLVKNAVLTDPTNGVYEFQWDPGDLVAGTVYWEVQHTDTSGKIQTINRHAENGELLEFVIDAEVA